MSWVASFVFVVTGWAILAPPQLGGSFSYVITDGISMLPHFHAGDLVILHPEPAYRVGDVAAYHNGQLHVVVMHRIVAVDGDRFVFKGDNNGFKDSFEPKPSQVIGIEWLHLPGWGRYVEVLRSPVVAAVLLGIMWIVSFGPKSTRTERRRRHNRGR